MFTFRKTEIKDSDNVMKIIKQAQDYFKKNHINQWQNNYPNSQSLKDDMANGYSYVLLKGEHIVATVAISFDGEETYRCIYDGNWLSEGKYAVIHRLAVDNAYKGSGVSLEIINHVEKMCLEKSINSMKIDTHEQNLPMQRFLQRNGFQYCGMIYLEDKSERMAFEKII